MGLVASRFGIGGVIVVGIIMFAMGGLGSFTGGGGQQAVGPARTTGKSAAEICQSDPTTKFTCQAYTSTERVWEAIFRGAGKRFDPPQLIFYDGRGQSGCGAAEAAMGPFYCPADQGIYIDTHFFTDLSTRLGAPGDFAQAYVVAHEMGHHIQTITGTSNAIRSAQGGASERESNALQVRMELQADCLAGVWANQARRAGATLEPGDLEEGLRAAGAIGDDTLQQSAGRRPVPESFTHGTSAQRQEALRRGFQGGTPDSCASYTRGI
jgi:predicted metalloprotease